MRSYDGITWPQYYSEQPLFRLIYSLKLVKLKMLKTYIITNLANNFIQPFKPFVKIFIIFN